MIFSYTEYRLVGPVSHDSKRDEDYFNEEEYCFDYEADECMIAHTLAEMYSKPFKRSKVEQIEDIVKELDEFMNDAERKEVAQAIQDIKDGKVEGDLYKCLDYVLGDIETYAECVYDDLKDALREYALEDYFSNL